MLKLFCNIFVISFMIMASYVHNSYAKNGIFSYGLIAGMDSIKNGGGFEFGFGLFRNKKIDFRNYISATAFVLNDKNSIPNSNPISLFVLSDKLMLGKALFIRGRVVRPYGFIGASIGAFDKPDTAISTFEGPYYYELFAGAGVDLRIAKKSTFFIETSLASSNITNSASRAVSYSSLFNTWKSAFDKGYVKFNAGIRFFF